MTKMMSTISKRGGHEMMMSMIMVVTVVLQVKDVCAAGCSSSCLVQEDIISCRRFDRPADIRACVHSHPSASVLDLSYIDIRVPLTRRTLAGLHHIAVLYLDGSRIRRVETDALARMDRLRTVFVRRMRTRLPVLLDAVVASPTVRQVAIADNFVSCSCSWLRVVERLTAVDVVIVDMLDAAPRCSHETVQRCRPAARETHSQVAVASVARGRSSTSRAGRPNGHRHRSHRDRRATGTHRQRSHHHKRKHRQQQTAVSQRKAARAPKPATGGKAPRGGGHSYPKTAAGGKVAATKATPAAAAKVDGGSSSCPAIAWISHTGTIGLLTALVLLVVLGVVVVVTPVKHKLFNLTSGSNKKGKDKAKKGGGKKKDSKKKKVSIATKKRDSTQEKKKSTEGSFLQRLSFRRSTAAELPAAGRESSQPVDEPEAGERTVLVPEAVNVNESQGGGDDDGATSRSQTRPSIRDLFTRNLLALRRQSRGQPVSVNVMSTDDDEEEDEEEEENERHARSDTDMPITDYSE